jgi:hypothetical protein
MFQEAETDQPKLSPNRLVRNHPGFRITLVSRQSTGISPAGQPTRIDFAEAESRISCVGGWRFRRPSNFCCDQKFRYDICDDHQQAGLPVKPWH